MSKEKERLYQIILTPSQRRDYLAIELYLDIKDNLKKTNQSVFKTSYSYFTKKYKCSNENIRKKFVLLENLGLIKRSFTDEVLSSGYKVSNVLNLTLLSGGKI
jgi:hypothetical protein